MSSETPVWMEEVEVLCAIYGSESVEVQGNSILLTIKEYGLTIHYDMSNNYPHTHPIVRSTPEINDAQICTKIAKLNGSAILYDIAILMIENMDMPTSSRHEEITVLQYSDNVEIISKACVNSNECWTDDFFNYIDMELVRESLIAASFLPIIYNSESQQLIHHSSGVIVSLYSKPTRTPLVVEAEGVDNFDFVDAIKIFISTEKIENFGRFLCSWVTETREQSNETPGFSEGIDEYSPELKFGDLYLPPRSIAQQTRDLTIYTWGRAIMKHAPADSQRSFNAGVLNGRGHGVDLRKMNGLSPEVQNVVFRCKMFPGFIEMMVSAIERENLKFVSIVCTKGRHRSVASAELLKSIYYPKANVKHLTIR